MFKKLILRPTFAMTSRCSGLFFCLVAFLLISTRALALDKKASFALSHYIMAVVYDDLGDIDKAIQEYKKALKVDSNSAVIHLNLAESLIKKNDIPGAIQELNLVARINPEAIEPHAILAILYSSQNKPDLATGEYETALKGASKLNPKNIDIYKSLGLIYLQQKRFKEAIETYQLISNLSPLDAQAYFYLGSIHNELKNNDLAEKELQRALELKSDYHEALNFLGYLYVEENKNLPQAELMIKKALELEPDNGAYTDSLGWLYFKQGKFQEAIKELEKACSLLQDPVVYEHLGEVYLKINDIAKAGLNWQKA
ncbi:MAG: tetratricopeptide repeat protein, partial [Candidatus Omnitrophica bacterium]|nr:tetratricopeptide repeat protein [Candidatus Omnitrophota bacterium]